MFVVEKGGSIFEVTLALNGITTGALLGLFTMGILFRKANTKVITIQQNPLSISYELKIFKGVICGATSSVIILLTIVIGSFNAPKKMSTLPLRTDGCDFDFMSGL